MAMSNGPHLNGNAVFFRTKKWTGGNPITVFKLKNMEFVPNSFTELKLLKFKLH